METINFTELEKKVDAIITHANKAKCGITVLKEDIDRFNNLSSDMLINMQNSDAIKELLKMHINDINTDKQDILDILVELNTNMNKLITEIIKLNTKDIVKNKFNFITEEILSSHTNKENKNGI